MNEQRTTVTAHVVWKSQNKYHSTFRAKRAMLTFWMDKSKLKMPKMVHLGEFLKIWSLRSNSVTRQFTFNRTKIGWKCQHSKIQMRQLWVVHRFSYHIMSQHKIFIPVLLQVFFYPLFLHANPQKNLYLFFHFRYQCLQCINYDLCQHCFFYGMISQNHKISHPIQEYCYKSTKKEATSALLNLVANNLGLSKTSRSRSLFKKKERKRRYLPHDPEMVLEQTVNETIDEQPVTVEALNLHPMIQKNLVSAETPCSSGFHSVSFYLPLSLILFQRQSLLGHRTFSAENYFLASSSLDLLQICRFPVRIWGGCPPGCRSRRPYPWLFCPSAWWAPDCPWTWFWWSPTNQKLK